MTESLKSGIPAIQTLSSPDWQDYELLDSGNGLKLERFGAYTFSRPEPQAVWRPSLPERDWKAAHATFITTNEENGGHFLPRVSMEPRWQMRYKSIRFWAEIASSRHLGVFPEQASQWDWAAEQIQGSHRSLNILNLFGYTGLASLYAAVGGAKLTHVDASKKTITRARENQILSGLQEKPIRWIVDDALKFVERESRRKSYYDGLILDPPKFGRGPKGEVWEFYKLLPALLQQCRDILSSQPVFIILTAYAIQASSLTLFGAMEEMTRSIGGQITAGELVTIEKSAHHVISNAIFARWSSNKE